MFLPFGPFWGFLPFGPFGRFYLLDVSTLWTFWMFLLFGPFGCFYLLDLLDVSAFWTFWTFLLFGHFYLLDVSTFWTFLAFRRFYLCVDSKPWLRLSCGPLNREPEKETALHCVKTKKGFLISPLSTHSHLDPRTGRIIHLHIRSAESDVEAIAQLFVVLLK